nr:DUF4932 domain-containing protein [Thermococcus peptonophilus]
MAYKNSKVMLYETFVRAFVVHYLNVTEGPKAAMRELRIENVTFYFIGDVYNAYVNDYMKHRDKYKTFDDFMPELAKVIEKVYERTEGGKKISDS